MASKKEAPAEVVATTPDFTQMNVYQKLQFARQMFLESGVKKSGINPNLEFTYFELKDIIPTATKIFSLVGLVGIARFGADTAYFDIVDTDHPENNTTVYAPFTQIMPIISNSGKKVTNEMQALGSSITYMRRYLWLIAMDIIEADEIDGTLGMPETPKEEAPKKPATPAERKEIKEELTAPAAPADELQVTALRNALKQLLALDPEQESFVQEVAVKTNGFTEISKEQCEALVNGVGEMILAYSAQEA